MGRYVQKHYGSIQLEEREDDTVVIVLEYQAKDLRKKIELKLRDLSDFLTPEMEAQGIKEDLHESWFSQREENSWIVYRQDDAKALYFVSQSFIEMEDLLCIMEERSYFSMRFNVEKNPVYAYFSALALAWQIKSSFGLSMPQLFSLDGMDKERLALLAQCSELLPLFKEQGIDIKQLALVDSAKLKSCLENRWELKAALSLISLAQILGLNAPAFKPLEERPNLSENTPPAENILPEYGASGSSATSEGEFHYTIEEQSLKFTYKRTHSDQEGINLYAMSDIPGFLKPYKGSYIFFKHEDTRRLYYITTDGVAKVIRLNDDELFESELSKIQREDDEPYRLSAVQEKMLIRANGGYDHLVWCFNFEFGTIKKEVSATIEKEMSQGSLETLIHDWYGLVSFKHSSRYYYSPPINFIIKEELEPDYAAGYTELMLDPMGFSLFNILQSRLPYYEEKQFIEELQAQDLSLEAFKNISGFSKETLLLLSKAKDWRKLISEEVNFHQLASVDERCLVSLLQNQKEAKAALKFIDIFELLGIEKKIELSREVKQEMQSALDLFGLFCLPGIKAQNEGATPQNQEGSRLDKCRIS